MISMAPAGQAGVCSTGARLASGCGGAVGGHGAPAFGSGGLGTVGDGQGIEAGEAGAEVGLGTVACVAGLVLLADEDGEILAVVVLLFLVEVVDFSEGVVQVLVEDGEVIGGEDEDVEVGGGDYGVVAFVGVGGVLWCGCPPPGGGVGCLVLVDSGWA